MFLQLLLAGVITDVITLIDKYSYNIYQKTDKLKEENHALDKLFSSWIKLVNKDAVIRNVLT
jgi:hypothetical protein